MGLIDLITMPCHGQAFFLTLGNSVPANRLCVFALYSAWRSHRVGVCTKTQLFYECGVDSIDLESNPERC